MYLSGDTLMNYKSYPTKKSTPSRLARKGARRNVFLFNKYEAKKLKSKLRRERRALAE